MLRRRRRREACYLNVQARDSPRSATARPPGAVLLSLLAVPRIYPKSLLSLRRATRVIGAYPKSRLSLLELARTYNRPPSLCRFATQGLLPLRWHWDVASPHPVCRVCVAL